MTLEKFLNHKNETHGKKSCLLSLDVVETEKEKLKVEDGNMQRTPVLDDSTESLG